MKTEVVDTYLCCVFLKRCTAVLPSLTLLLAGQTRSNRTEPCLCECDVLFPALGNARNFYQEFLL